MQPKQPKMLTWGSARVRSDLELSACVRHEVACGEWLRWWRLVMSVA
jgi:hypothetical protein